jgi:ABC-type amino acid transport substrate-binding protein
VNTFRRILASLGVAALAISPLHARPLAKIRKEGLTVAVRPGPLPFGAASGPQRGLDVDLITALAEGMGVRYRITEIASFPEAQTLLAADKIDLIIGGVRSTPELKASNLVTAPYYKSGLGILALRSNRELYTLSDLDGRPVAATPEIKTTKTAKPAAA